MFAQVFADQARRHADRPFLVFEGHAHTWRQTAETVARTASLLADRGVSVGDRVLLAAGNSPVFINLWFALRWLGATSVPLHTAATSVTIAAMASDADLRHVVGDADLLAQVAEAAPQLGESATMFTNYDDLVSRTTGLPERQPHPPDQFDESSLLYTSGTTGTPKGVRLCDTVFLAGGQQLASALELTEVDRIQLALPLFHANPQIYGVMTALSSGCSVALETHFDPAAFIDQAAEVDATGFTYVGTVLSLLLERTETVPEHRLRFCVGGGAPEPLWRAVEDQVGVGVHELYGMTETGGWVTATTTSHRRLGACGRVRNDMELVILDDDDAIVPAGHLGQIAVRGRHRGVLFDCYHNRPELTAKRWAGGWFHTGDLGHLDADGYLYFHGRADEMIRRGGENVSPGDVEQALGAHPDVAEVAVVGVPDDIMGQEIKAVVVPAGPGFPVKSLPEFLNQRLPRFAWPRYVEVRSSLPRTPTQKIQRRDLITTTSEMVDLRQLAGKEGAR